MEWLHTLWMALDPLDKTRYYFILVWWYGGEKFFGKILLGKNNKIFPLFDKINWNLSNILK